MKTTLSVLSLLATGALAQDLDSMMTQASANEPVQATFKAIRVVGSHSVETSGKGVLELTVSHRFGSLGNGPDGGFGLDMANTRIGVDYGITDRLNIGYERTNNEGKPLALWGKGRVLRQTVDGSMPLSVTWLSIGYLYTQDPEGVGSLPFQDKLASVHQLIVARKFTESFSLQLSPTMVQRSLVEYADDEPVSFGIGAAGRWKYTARQGVTLDVTQMLTGLHKVPGPAVGIGWEIETGGHVFQAHFANSGWISEDRAYTRGSQGLDNPPTWCLGFMITRAFGG